MDIYTSKKYKKKKRSKNNFFKKILFTIILTLVSLILLKGNKEFKNLFYKYVYQDSISFVTLNKLYKNIFGSAIPFSDIINQETVFSEKLEYDGESLYKDGVALNVSKNYLVPALEDGMVIFSGEKKDYGKVIIIEDINGLTTWYGNLDNTNLKLYDYVKKGTLIGSVNDKLYLVFEKDGEILEYVDKI